MSPLAEPLRNSSCSITDIQRWGNVLDRGHLEVGLHGGSEEHLSYLRAQGLRSSEGARHRFTQPLDAQSQRGDFLDSLQMV